MQAGKYFRLVLVAGVSLSLLFGASAMAQTAEPVAEPTNETVETTIASPAQVPSTTLEQRLTRRKAAFTTRLTTAQTTRLRARCEAAQTKLGTVKTRAESASGSRLTAFEAIQTNLDRLTTKLEDKADVTELKAALVTLDEKITAFETATADYKQTVADLVELNCTTDPTAFRASLESAKTERTEVVAAATAVRTHLKETIKPLLQAIRTSLANQESN